MYGTRRRGAATRETPMEDGPDANHGEDMMMDLAEEGPRVKRSKRKHSGPRKSTDNVTIDSIESEVSFQSVSNSSFLYDALESRNSIRLFTLEHGFPVKGILRQYSWKDCPRYEALSYTWGPKRWKENITINGLSFEIQRNLFKLLEQLCQENQQSAIWCDAICINQNDVEERNDQVQQMGRIYQQAKTVHVWLGPGADDSNTVLQCFQRDAHAPEQWYARTFGHARGEHFWNSLAKLCNREYWKRTWIVQEFLLAQDVQIRCGSKSTSWDAFDHVSKKFHDREMYRSQNSAGQAALDEMQGSTFVSLSKDRMLGQQTLEELLKKYGRTRCADSRDRVFGLLGLASDGNLVRVDYSQDAHRLWARIMLSYLPKERRSFYRHLETSLRLPKIDPNKLEILDTYMKQVDLKRSKNNPEDVEALVAFRKTIEEGSARRVSRTKHILRPLRDFTSTRDSPDVQMGDADAVQEGGFVSMSMYSPG